MPRSSIPDTATVRQNRTNLSNEPDDVCVGIDTERSWRISKDVWKSIPLLFDVIGDVCPGAPTVNIVLLLHGGNQICPGSGWWVYTRDKTLIMPIHEYLDVALRWMHAPDDEYLSCFVTLKSIVLFEHFVAILFKREFMPSGTPYHPLHIAVMKKVETHIARINDVHEVARQLGVMSISSRSSSSSRSDTSALGGNPFTLSCT